MTEFLELETLNNALRKFTSLIQPCRESEVIAVEGSLGRIAFETIYAEESAPAFTRSAVDGYAIIARDSFGASEGMPMFFNVIGEVEMGKETGIFLRTGQAVKIHTGGMLPANADCVVMLENAESTRADEIQINKACAVNENVILRGEDISKGDVILPKGSMINEAVIGGCLGQGICEVRAVRKMNVGIVSSGDELTDPKLGIQLGQVREINSGVLKALLTRNHANSYYYGIIPDKIDLLRNTVQNAFQNSDMVVITAGSSISERDNTAKVIGELGDPGIVVHGINIKPGKPTILAVCGGKPVIGLPGNPVSAFVVARLVVTASLYSMQGYTNVPVNSFEKAKLTVNVASQAGRTDFLPVRLFEKRGRLHADPLFYKSNLIFSLVKAQALAIIP